jgi:hypothetical protein
MSKPFKPFLRFSATISTDESSSFSTHVRMHPDSELEEIAYAFRTLLASLGYEDDAIDLCVPEPPDYLDD